MPYWIVGMLAGTPFFLWVYVGVGLPWALALLPRRDWCHRLTVLAAAFAFGSALLTVWMFALAMVGIPLRFDVVAVGLFLLMLVGLWLAWRKRAPIIGREAPYRLAKLPVDEFLLLLMMGAAFIIWWIVTAYWPFTVYDALWVYGYQGRLYTLLGDIPNTIGYYPQYIPLQYAFAQLAFGEINDHAARASLPFLQLGSILATYVLGARLFNPRTGIAAAALWTLYPHVGEWSRAGDLEIPMAFLFTLAAAFFLLAWLQRSRSYALLAGLVLGIGLWTKPTMGAFVWGVLLVAALEAVRVRFDWRLWWRRGQLALLTLVAAAPLGGVWYIRNILLGHPPVELPPGFWLTLAARSGNEFGWLLLALAVLLLYVYLRPQKGMRPDLRLTLPGVLLVLVAMVPTILQPARMGWLEWLALAAGVGLLVVAFARIRWSGEDRVDAAKLGWGLALALPYFITWFYSYSYHYRLSFAIVPLMILPTAAILARWLQPPRHVVLRALYLSGLLLIGLPGMFSTIYDPFGGHDYLWTDKYPDDNARYRSGNGALMNVVDGLQAWIDQHPGERLVVAAPGVERLPFFFPQHDIRVNDVPTQLDQIDDAAYFVYGTPEVSGAYGMLPPNPVIGSLGRTDIVRRAWGMDDGIFRYDVYELNLENRFVAPSPNAPSPDDVVIGGFARYLGHDLGGLELWPGRRIVFKLMWQVLETPTEDYTIFVHLRDRDGNLIANWDNPTARTEYGYYSTQFWQPGEYIVDERILSLPPGDVPLGEGYELVIGMYDSAQRRVPITIDGESVADSYTVENRISVRASEST